MEDWTPTNTSYAPAPISVEERKSVSILPKLRGPKKSSWMRTDRVCCSAGRCGGTAFMWAPWYSGSRRACLELNISKTRELCCRGRRAPDTSHPLFGLPRLEWQVAEQVEIFKYLGTEIDHRLSTTEHADRVYKKAQQCMSPLRSLKGFNDRLMESVHFGYSHSTLHPGATFCQRKKKKKTHKNH